MPTSHIQDRIQKMEQEREPFQPVPGKNPKEYDYHELLSLVLEVPVDEWQGTVLRGNREMLDRLRTLFALREARSQALLDGDFDRAAALRAERGDHHIGTILWMGQVFRAVRAEEEAQRQAALRRSARDALRRMPGWRQ